MATKEELIADRTAFVAARRALLSGQAVQEYSRDGRRVVYQRMSVDQVNAAIADLDDKLNVLDASSGAARPRYRALSIGFSC